MNIALETEHLCPNCGYQVKQEDYYCPSCRHRIEFTNTGNVEVVDLEPVAEKVQILKALLFSSLLYILSIVVSTVQFAFSYMPYNLPATDDSLLIMGSLALSALSVLYLAGSLFAPSRRLKTLHLPALLTLVLGIGNLLLLTALALIYPSSSTLNGIINQLGNNSAMLQLAEQYSMFFVLVGLAGMLGIIGIIGLLLVFLRSSRILHEPLIHYGLWQESFSP